MAALYAADPVLTQVYVRTLTRVVESAQRGLRSAAFSALLRKPTTFHQRHRSSALVSLLARDLESVRACAASSLARDRGLRALVEALGCVILLSYHAPGLGPMLVALAAATGAAAFLHRRQSRALERAHAAALGRCTALADEVFAALSTVRAFGGEGLAAEGFAAVLGDLQQAGQALGKARAALESTHRGATHLSLLALYGYGGYLLSMQRLSLRALLSAIGYTFTLAFATQGVLQTYAEARAAGGAWARARAVLDEDAEREIDFGLPSARGAGSGILPDGGQTALGPTPLLSPLPFSSLPTPSAFPPEIEFQRVWFWYGEDASDPSAAVLRDVSLTLPPGKVVALVGRSGAGKSSLAALLQGLHSPQKGRLLVGGRDARELSRGDWAALVSSVPQEPVLFSGSVADNISYGARALRWLELRTGRGTHMARGSGGEKKEESLEPASTCASTLMTPAAIEQAARLAAAHEFVLSLPLAYASDVGLRGSRLSGGQRQRVALARALLKPSPVMVLDEATAALDGSSERLALQGVAAAARGRTLVVIAHRLATVRQADLVVVLEQGKVVEQGPHDALLAQEGGAYRQLVASQELVPENAGEE